MGSRGRWVASRTGAWKSCRPPHSLPRERSGLHLRLSPANRTPDLGPPELRENRAPLLEATESVVRVHTAPALLGQSPSTRPAPGGDMVACRPGPPSLRVPGLQTLPPAGCTHRKSLSTPVPPHTGLDPKENSRVEMAFRRTPSSSPPPPGIPQLPLTTAPPLQWALR